MPGRLKPPPPGNYSIACPYCRDSNLLAVSIDLSEVRCPSCGQTIRVLIATVRAKRGRASGPQREYVIRTITHSGEGVLRFVDAGGSDLDLRSGDIMYVVYKMKENRTYDETPSLLCNVTTHQGTIIKPRKSGCFIATVACGYGSWEVKVLSGFRDDILSKSEIGSLFIALYYTFSPFFASFIVKRENLKKNIRRFIIFPAAALASRMFKIKCAWSS